MEQNIFHSGAPLLGLTLKVILLLSFRYQAKIACHHICTHMISGSHCHVHNVWSFALVALKSMATVHCFLHPLSLVQANFQSSLHSFMIKVQNITSTNNNQGVRFPLPPRSLTYFEMTQGGLESCPHHRRLARRLGDPRQ